MDYEAQLKLQAYLDGELPEGEAREIANWLARDREAVALHAELRNVRQALVGQEIGVTLPESREFFWSKIEREIQQLEPGTSPAPRSASWVSILRRFLMPALGIATVALAALLLLPHEGGPAMETALADSGAMVYHDYSAGATFVWFSYPAESELSDNEPDSEIN